jgi:hypothetical protein
MVVFTKRILETATDAKGLRPTDPGFDNLTLKITDDIPFADGGRAGFAEGGWNPGVGRDTGGYQSDHGSYTGGDGDGNVNTIVTNTGDGNGAPVVATPTNVGNPFGYQDNIMTAALDTRKNRYDTDLEEDTTGLAGLTFENMTGLKPDPITENTKLVGLNKKQTGYLDKVGNKIPTALGTTDLYTYDNAASIKKEIEKLNKKSTDMFGTFDPDKITYSADDTTKNTFATDKDVEKYMKDKYGLTIPTGGTKIGLAEGGRAGYRIGGIAKAILKKINKKKVKDAVDDIFETGDYKYDAELAAEALVENNPKLFGGKLIDDIDEGLRSEIYGLTLAELSTRMALKMQARRAGKIPFTETVTEAVRPQFQLNVEKAVSQLNIPKAEATRIAQLPSSEQKLALQKYLDTDMAQRTELMNYEPRKFDAAHGGLAKILEV